MTIANMPANYALDTAAQGARWSRPNLLAMYKVAKQRRAAYRQTVKELSSLQDRELNDIGISRADIHRLARQESLKV